MEKPTMHIYVTKTIFSKIPSDLNFWSHKKPMVKFSCNLKKKKFPLLLEGEKKY